MQQLTTYTQKLQYQSGSFASTAKPRHVYFVKRSLWQRKKNTNTKTTQKKTPEYRQEVIVLKQPLEQCHYVN